MKAYTLQVLGTNEILSFHDLNCFLRSVYNVFCSSEDIEYLDFHKELIANRKRIMRRHCSFSNKIYFTSIENTILLLELLLATCDKLESGKKLLPLYVLEIEASSFKDSFRKYAGSTMFNNLRGYR